MIDCQSSHSRKQTVFAIVIALSLPSSTSATDMTANNSSLAGKIQCNLSNYAWPSSDDQTPTPTGTGTIELVADGKGYYTSGTMTEHVADDTQTGGEDLCRFTLVSGSYTVASDGRGTASTVWKLASGGDSHCANLDPGRRFPRDSA